MLLVHDGNEAFFGDPDGYRRVLSMHDAWDEAYWERVQTMAFAFIPHPRYAHHERLKAALDFNRPLLAVISDEDATKPFLPARQSLLQFDAPNAVLSVFYRENDGQPTVRLYEVDGQPTEVRIRSVANIAAATEVNLLGDRLSSLGPKADSVEIRLRPREIATVKLDRPAARKHWRNLDAHRNVWVKSGKKEQVEGPHSEG